MAHRKKPTTKEGVKSWNAEHKGTKKSGGGWKYAIPGVGPLLAISDANKIHSKNRTKLTNKSKGSSKDQDDARKEAELSTYLKNKPKGGYTAKNAGPDKGVTGKKFIPKSKKTSKSTPKSTVHTRHYKTGEALGVMTRSQRRAYDKEAAGRTFEGQVAKHEKESGHGKSHKRETLYKASLRKKGSSKKSSSKNGSNRETLKATQGKPMPSNPDFRGPGNNKKFKKKKKSYKGAPLGSRLADNFD